MNVIDCLDRGFVRLVDSMGNDVSIVQAARVSYDAGTKTPEQDAKLIDYLMRNKHTSPFEQVVLVFHVKLPLFVFAQLVRHRTARLNAQSARYTVMTDEFYFPTPDQVRGQGTGNKQVGDGLLTQTVATTASDAIIKTCERAYGTYQELLELGVCREQARMVLPQNLYTQCYWQMDLHNLLKFIELRDHPHAQMEIRVYAKAFLRFAKMIAPVSVMAWERHRRQSNDLG
jgi:thymidylate synthase (FAD)